MSTTTPGPSLVCPGCGSRDVDLRRGLFCGTCTAGILAIIGSEKENRDR